MSSSRSKKFLTPYIIGASDLAFILLFFFIMVGSGSQKLERIDMPYKSASAVNNQTQAPFRVEIYERTDGSDTSRLALIFDRAEPPETLFVSVDNNGLSEPTAYNTLVSEISGFVSQWDVESDSIRVDIFSSAFSYYGVIAIAIAACNQLEYPCNLVYKTEAG